MNQTLNEIIEQIKSGEIKFYYSDKVLQDLEPKNIDQLIYIAADNYTYNTIEDFDGYVDDLEFRTEGSDTPLKELLENNIKSTGFYFYIAGPKGSNVVVEIEFPKYNDETDFEEYIEDLFDTIDKKIIDYCYEFNADDEFNELWSRSSTFTAREFLEILDEDEAFFKELANKVISK
jgi:hypothetical protein